MRYYTEKDSKIILKQFLLRYGFILNQEGDEFTKLMQVCLNRFDERTIEHEEEWTHETINRNSLLQCADDNKKPHLIVDALVALLARRILRPTSAFTNVDFDSPVQIQRWLMDHADTEFGYLFYFDKENLDLEMEAESSPVKNEKSGQDSAAIMNNADLCSLFIEADHRTHVGIPYLKLVIPNWEILEPDKMVSLFKELGEVTNKYGIPIVINDHTNKEDTKNG